MSITPLDIVRRTPRSNCGQCGQPSCLAFAVLITSANADPGRCPYLDTTGLELPTGNDSGSSSRQRDLALVARLKEKVAALDLQTIAPGLGAQWSAGEPTGLRFRYLGQEVWLTKEGLLLDGRQPEDPRDQILLYNYLHSGGGPPPARRWVGLESLPNSISKVKTLATYCENRLADLFSSRSHQAIATAASRLEAETAPATGASLGLVIPVLPMVPHYLLYWQAEPEDGFAASVKVLFDRQVLRFLDLESLVFSAERLAERLADLLNATP